MFCLKVWRIAAEHLACVTIFIQAGITSKGTFFCNEASPLVRFPSYPLLTQEDLILIKTNTQSEGIIYFRYK